jgi:hypothetical protein
MADVSAMCVHAERRCCVSLESYGREATPAATAGYGWMNTERPSVANLLQYRDDRCNIAA